MQRSIRVPGAQPVSESRDFAVVETELGTANGPGSCIMVKPALIVSRQLQTIHDREPGKPSELPSSHPQPFWHRFCGHKHPQVARMKFNIEYDISPYTRPLLCSAR